MLYVRRALRWLPRGFRVLLGLASILALAAGCVLLWVALLTQMADLILNAPAATQDTHLLPELAPTIITVVAIALVVGCVLTALRRTELIRAGFALGAGMSIGIAGVLMLLIAAILVRGAIGRGDQPQSLWTAGLTVLAFCVLSGTILGGAISWALGRWADFELPSDAIAQAVAVGLLFLVFVLVEDPPEPPMIGRGGLTPELFGRPDVAFDLVLLVNPRDAAARRLIRIALSEPALLTRPRDDTVAWDTAYGLAIVDGAGGHVVQQPDADRRKLVAALRSIGTRPSAQSTPNYGAALATLANPRAVRWRENARRGVTIVAETPPDRRLLGPPRGYLPDFTRPKVIDLYEPKFGSGFDYRLDTVHLDVLADRASAGELASWRMWTGASAGRFMIRRSDRGPLAQAEDSATDTSSATYRKLAVRYRPYLRFDSGEHRVPLDVDRFLGERGPDGRPSHRMCRKLLITYFDCRDIRSAVDLKPMLNDRGAALALDVNPQRRPADEFEGDSPQRIYYHAEPAEKGTRLHIDYWMFYRFNDAPLFPQHTCLSGLSVAEATCFDHEGDWEGVTVSLARDTEAWRPESVSYAGHAWRHRFSWQALAEVGATEGTQPVVWVARGSHASYPAPCGEAARIGCRQPGLNTPDGPRDGAKPWWLNDDHECELHSCVLELPQTARGGPASWAAFGGRWGLPRCTLGTTFCVRALGPESPWFQKRYAQPGAGRIEDPLLRQWYPLSN
jgi:hypothetical protein